MHCPLLLVSLAGGVLGVALPEFDARDVHSNNARLRTKVITKHATTTTYVITTGLPCEKIDSGAGGDSVVTMFTTDTITTTQTAFVIPTGLASRPFVVGDGESYSIPDVTPVSVALGSSATGTVAISTTCDCDFPDTPEAELLPDAACGFYFDDYLDEFYGYYDFSDISFSAALQDFAPGLSSYSEDDFGEDDLPPVVTVGGQEFSASSKVSAPLGAPILPRTPQGSSLKREDFEDLEEYLRALAIEQNDHAASRALEANRSQGRPKLESEIRNDFGMRLREQLNKIEVAARLRKEQADRAAQASQVVGSAQASAAAEKAEADATAAQAKAVAAAAAAATADAAKVAQIMLDRKTLPVLPGNAVAQSNTKAEPLVVGKKVAEAAVGTFSNTPDKLKQIQDQANSVVQKVQTAPKPTGLVPRAVDDVSSSSASPTGSGDLNSAVSGLINPTGEQQNLHNSKTAEFSYSTVGDLSGRFFLLADDSGTLSLTAEPPSADTFALKTFVFFKGALAADARKRLVVFFPETMNALGVSRFRVAPLNETSFDARAAAMIPVQLRGDGGASAQVLIPVDTEGMSYAFVACNVVVDGVSVNKLFIVKDQDTGAKTLLDKATRSEVTGGVVDECFPVALKSSL